MQHRTFSGERAARQGRRILFVTERCVFRLTEAGLELAEVAPGIEIERDIFANMAFQPQVSAGLKPMDARIFSPEPMGLRDDMLDIPLEQRISFDASRNILFLNFEHLTVKTLQDVEAIRQQVEHIIMPLGHKVYAVVNYDEFALAPDIENDYLDMVRDLVSRLYTRVNRYTTSTFLRLKLGDALARRGVAPHIYENSAEAESHLT